MPNRLAREHSPYLLQHKDNPVDWYSWGDEAFERARREDKPIFLSIGYSTCHWCHVMEHESFENSDVAHVLNREFVSIKVDREERPDVDRVYMTFVQATTGSGGWPMSVWLTPRLEPFYGGTYFPPTPRWGKPGFVQVLEEIARVWREERDKVEGSASSIVDRLRSFGGTSGGAQVPGPEALTKTVRDFASAFDARRGGFGEAPKFPRPSELLFLMREFARTGDGHARDMALITLRAMALGGMRDHVGGGFHRYAVDADWRVPHFEKMLYDQAQLALAYIEAAQITHDPFYGDVAADTLDYVRRDLADPAGGFYSAEDADTVLPEALDSARAIGDNERPAHKMEGAFYVWRDDEIGEVLGEDADLFRARFGVQPGGNAPFDPQNEFNGRNLLYMARPVEEVARMCGRTSGEVEDALARARATLLERRASRPRPHLDDKVLTAWNGLMIAAFARAARVLDEGERYLDAARGAATFVRARLWNEQDGSLLRRYRQGNASVEGYAEDYAYLTFGLLELFEADGNPEWLAWARRLQQRQDELFWDHAHGGWFSTTGRDPSVLLRLKEDYDGAEPAASSVSALNVLMLSHLFDDPALAEHLERTFSAFGERAIQLGRAIPMMMAALSTYHAGVAQVVVAGDLASPDARALADPIRQTYLPATIVIPAVPRHHEWLVELLPWTAAMPPRDGRPTAYVCRNFACEAPTTSPEQVQVLLNGISR